MKLCKVDGCEGQADKPGTARGYCSKHYGRLMRHGTTDESALAWQHRGPVCTVDGCERKHDCKGYCSAHYQKWKKYGDPLGGKFTWGEVRSYESAHWYVKREKGPAREQKCSHCGEQAEEWAYDHQDPDEHQRNGVPYSLKINHYMPLCKPCHRLFDAPHTAKEAM